MIGLAYIFPKIPQKSAFFSFSCRYVEDGISTCKCWVFSQHLNNYAGNHLLHSYLNTFQKRGHLYLYKDFVKDFFDYQLYCLHMVRVFPSFFFFFFFFIQYMHSRLSSFKVASDTYHTGNLNFGSNK
jgi:hypothetical protein